MDLWDQLINHGVSKHKIDKKLTTFLFGLNKQKRSQANQRMVTLDGGKKQIQLMCQFPDMSRFADPECHQ